MGKALKKVETVSREDVKELPKQSKGSRFAAYFAGVALVLFSVSVFIQFVPLMYVFIGAYLGIKADATIGSIDSIVWILTSLTLMLIVVYGFIRWMTFLTKRFFIQAKPLFRFKKHKQ